MLYTRFGEPVRLMANAGECKPTDFVAPVTLVKVQSEDDATWCRFYFAEFLKADGGWPEICNAVEKAEKVKLNNLSLEAAIQEAL